MEELTAEQIEKGQRALAVLDRLRGMFRRSAYVPTEGQREVMEAERIKERARLALQSARRRGKVTKPDTCEKCGARPDDIRNIHGHHTDYSRPLDVVWVCRDCHYAEHQFGRVPRPYKRV